MSRDHAFAVSASPKTLRSEPDTPHADATLDAAPPTKRFTALGLATALAAMAAVEDEDESATVTDEEASTLTLSAEDNRELLAKAFRLHQETAPATNGDAAIDLDDEDVASIVPACESGVRRVTASASAEVDFAVDHVDTTDEASTRLLVIALWAVAVALLAAVAYAVSVTPS